MGDVARTRLASERKNLRKDRPFGFVAKPSLSTLSLLHRYPLCSLQGILVVNICPSESLLYPILGSSGAYLHPCTLRAGPAVARIPLPLTSPLSPPTSTEEDGSTDLMNWTCSIPGKEGTDWGGANYPIRLEFGPDYHRY